MHVGRGTWVGWCGHNRYSQSRDIVDGGYVQNRMGKGAMYETRKVIKPVALTFAAWAKERILATQNSRVVDQTRT